MHAGILLSHIQVHLDPEAYSKPCETLTWHIENFARTVCEGIIQPCSGIFITLYSPCIWRNLAYSGSWNIQNPSIILSRRICHMSYVTLEIQFPCVLAILGYPESPDLFTTWHIFRTFSKI